MAFEKLTPILNTPLLAGTHYSYHGGSYGLLNQVQRRHSKDYEKTTESSEAFTYISMIALMSKRHATA